MAICALLVVACTNPEADGDVGAVGAYAVASADECYLSGDANDRLSVFTKSDFNAATNEVNVGSYGGGHTRVEAIAYDPTTSTLFGADADELGSINVDTGVFTTIATFGSGDGSIGTRTMTDVDGLAIDPFTGRMWGCHRRGGNDLLFQFDPATGSLTPGAFSGDEYVTIGIVAGNADCDDIAFDPFTGTMYASLTGGGTGHIVRVSLVDGTTTDVGPTARDIEAITFDSSGQLWGVSGTTDQVWEISTATGAATNPRPIDNSGDYEGMACFTVSSANLGVAKTVSDATPPEGATIRYTLVVTNTGPHDAAAVSVTDVLPAGVTFVGASASSGSYDSGSGVWTIGAMLDGASETLTITVTVDAGTSGTAIDNTAIIASATTGDPDPSNDRSTVTITPSRPLCLDDATGLGSTDTGCATPTPQCDTSGGSAVCEPCVDSGAGRDDGCDGMDSVCDAGASPNVCVACFDTATGAMTDEGCVVATPLCDTSGARPLCVACLDDAVMGDDSGCSGRLNICDETSMDPAHVCIDCVDSAGGGAVDDGCVPATRFCFVGTGLAESCHECRADGDCSGTEICDPATFTCRPECLTNSDCSGATPACDPRTLTCVPCVDTSPMAMLDSGCTGAAPICNGSGTVGAECVACLDTASGSDDLGCAGVLNVCDEASMDPAHFCIDCIDTDPGAGTDNGCASVSPFCFVSGGASAQCHECRTDGDCPGSETCNASNTCVPGCRMNSDCASPTPICNPTTMMCEECLAHADCPAGAPVCEPEGGGGRCVPCVDTMPGAAMDQGCTGVAPICEGSGTAAATCVPCLDTATGDMLDDGCAAAAPVCDTAADRCVECTENAHCASRLCDVSAGACVTCTDTTAGAGQDEGCDAMRPICEGSGTAMAACRSCMDTTTAPDPDLGCSMDDPICAGAGTDAALCAPCRDDQDGPGTDEGCASAAPICAGGGTPMARCTTCADSGPMGVDDGCTAAAPVCVESATDGDRCFECTVDDECTDGRTCEVPTGEAGGTCSGDPDTDGDGIPDPVDIDDDNDGILDTVETGGVDLSGDADGDGVPDYADPDVSTCTDTDGDGRCDSLSATVDMDGDGIPNHLDLDSDGDNIPDAIEGHDADGDGEPDVTPAGADGDDDGLDDAFDPDASGAPAPTPDHDADGAPDFLDVDSDGDGIPDVIEGNDRDADGEMDTPASGDDADGDGLDDAFDPDQGGSSVARQDTDGDGTPDYLDPDDDGDGVVTAEECPDPTAPCPDEDSDGTPDYLEGGGTAPPTSGGLAGGALCGVAPGRRGDAPWWLVIGLGALLGRRR